MERKSDTEAAELWIPRYPFAKLTEPDRVATILWHRKEVAGFSKLVRTELVPGYEMINPAGRVNLPNHFRGLTSISINDMDPWEFTYSFGNKVELEIMEDVQTFIRGILLAQDEEGNVVFVSLYNDYPNTQDTLIQQKLGFGTRISIANPYMKIALDGRTMIRLEDDIALFIYKDKDLKKCRFCSKPNSTKSCSRCKRAFYCSRECQTHDWKILKHKLICDVYKRYA